MTSLLTVKNLTVSVNQLSKKALIENLSFSLPFSSSLAIIGPSGSGKTVLAKSIMNLLPTEFHIEGDIIFKDLSLLHSRRIKNLLGLELSMIFQNPSSSLNPKMPIGKQIAEAILYHFPQKKKEIRELTLDLLEKVKIPYPIKYLKKYPFELSGGEKQKILIAIAISCHPSLIIADEPTSSLDPISRHHIITLLQELKISYKFNFILISHDFSLIPNLCDKILIINEGKIIEQGGIDEITKNPKKEISKVLFSNSTYSFK